jgi:hypothetical protein
MASSHRRRQSSLETIPDCSPTTPIPSDKRARGKDILTRLLAYYRNLPPPTDPASKPKPRPYSRADLLELVYEHAVSEQGQDRVLHYLLVFFLGGGLERQEQQEQQLLHATPDFSDVLTTLAGFDSWDQPRKTAVTSRIEGVADLLVDRFFLPRKLFFSFARPR